jgi:hypothetical protein
VWLDQRALLALLALLAQQAQKDLMAPMALRDPTEMDTGHSVTKLVIQALAVESCSSLIAITSIRTLHILKLHPTRLILDQQALMQLSGQLRQQNVMQMLPEVRQRIKVVLRKAFIPTLFLGRPVPQAEQQPQELDRVQPIHWRLSHDMMQHR